jgi:hypothetical protein
VNGDVQLQIAERAYFIWRQKGCPDGTELENWLEAETALSMENTPRVAHAAEVPTGAKRRQRTKHPVR